MFFYKMTPNNKQLRVPPKAEYKALAAAASIADTEDGLVKFCVGEFKVLFGEGESGESGETVDSSN